MTKTATKPATVEAVSDKKQTKASKSKTAAASAAVATPPAVQPKPKKQAKQAAAATPAAASAPAPVQAAATAPVAVTRPVKPAPQLDALGSRVGTKAAAINAALTQQPQTMKTIMEAAGQSQTFYNHLNKLVENGKVTKSAEGYALAPAK